jgi:S1-C subfamily serine protease
LRLLRPASGLALVLVACAASSAVAATAPDATDGIARAIAYTVTLEGNGVYGAGVLVAPAAGLVLTNLHVIEDMKEPRATFFDGTSAPAKVKEIDRTLDLALVEVPPQPARPAPVWGDATRLRPGEEVYAVGNPRHLSFTVSRGIVSFVGRMMDGGTRYLQTDLPINDGNSGGPVVNARGELVGLMTFVLKHAQGLSFALPVNYAATRFAVQLGKQRQPADYLERFRRWLQATR